MLYLGNAFSLQMLSSFPADVRVEELGLEEVVALLQEGFVSCVGHADTANVLTSVLGIEVPMNRMSVRLSLGDTLVVAQVMGGRLPEGATTLPEGVRFAFLKVTLV